jgi:hypothetical protein
VHRGLSRRVSRSDKTLKLSKSKILRINLSRRHDPEYDVLGLQRSEE